MIVGIGSDLTNIARVEEAINNYGERFINRIFSGDEVAEMARRQNISKREYASMASKRFAAKEACSKALGTGLQKGTFWRNMEVSHLPSGKPMLKLSGKALEHAQSLCKDKKINLMVTMTDDYPWAQAFVIIEAV